MPDKVTLVWEPGNGEKTCLFGLKAVLRDDGIAIHFNGGGVGCAHKVMTVAARAGRTQYKQMYTNVGLYTKKHKKQDCITLS